MPRAPDRLRPLFALVFCAPLAFPGPGRAAPADPRAILAGEPMRVEIVHAANPACEPHCPEWIAAEGKILARTPADFQKVLRTLGNRKIPVLVNSQGGSVEAAIAIGRLIRRRGLDVGVARSQVEGCASGDLYGCKTLPAGPLHGTPTSLRALCASACTLLFAGGAHRYAAPWSHIGVHQITTVMTQTRTLRQYHVTRLVLPTRTIETNRSLVKETKTSSTYVLARPTTATDRRLHAYLHEMTGSEALIPLMAATPASSIHWMTRSELKDTLLATTPVGGEAAALSPAAGNAVVEDGTKALVAPIEWSFTDNPRDGGNRLTGRAHFDGLKATASFSIASTTDPKAPAAYRLLADIRVDTDPARPGEPDRSSPLARFLVVGLSDLTGAPAEGLPRDPYFPAQSGDWLSGNRLATTLANLRDGAPVHVLLLATNGARMITVTFDPTGIRPAFTRALAVWGNGPDGPTPATQAASPAGSAQ